MQIQIKQHEIVEALKLYLTSKGLNLKGKKVEATFAMTRKPSEVTAEVNISETTVHIPGFTDSDSDQEGQQEGTDETKVSPVRLAVSNDPAPVDPSAEANPGATTEAEATDKATESDVDPEDPDDTNPTPKKTTSLFGG